MSYPQTPDLSEFEKGLKIMVEFDSAFRELLRHPIFSEVRSVMPKEATPREFSREMVKVLNRQLARAELEKAESEGRKAVVIDNSAVRQRALSLAITVHTSGADSEEWRVIRAAEEFEKYLLGPDES